MRMVAMPYGRGRIASALSVRAGEDEVSITTRKAGLRTALAAAIAGAGWLGWYLWRRDVFRDMTSSGLVTMAVLAAVVVLLLALAAAYALPGERLVASRSTGRIVLQRLWLAFPVAAREIDLPNCHRASLTEFTTQETVTDDSTDPGKAATVLGFLTGPLGSLLDLWAIWARRERRTIVVPVFAMEIVLRDGSSLACHFTKRAGECERALEAVWGLLPELRPRPPEETETKALEVGARVRVTLDAEWARNAGGTVTEPPPVIAGYGAAWTGHVRLEGGRELYWIESDEPQLEPGNDRPVKAGEMDSRFLEPV